MKKFNLKELFFIILSLVIICYLKKGSIYSDNYEEYMNRTIIWWSDSIFHNIVWLLPILMNFYVIGKKYFDKMLQFDIRYKNRERFICYMSLRFIVESLLVNAFLFSFQFLIVSILDKKEIIFNSLLFIFLIQYIVEITFANYLLIILSFVFKNFIYSYLMIVVFMLIGLIMFSPMKFVPFFDLYYSIHINFLTVFGLIGCFLVIKYFYKHYDIGGVEL